jgi:two-component system OmpR family response regulator
MKTPRILVVDDDDDVRAVIAAALRDEGYAVLTATNGCQALIEIAGAACDVILTDLRMPVMDGYELARVLDARGDQTPIIAMKAFGNQTPPRNSVTTLTKPFDVDTVVAVIEEAVRAA